MNKMSIKARIGVFAAGMVMLLASIYVFEGVFEGGGSKASKPSSTTPSSAPAPSQDNSAFSL